MLALAFLSALIIYFGVSAFVGWLVARFSGHSGTRSWLVGLSIFCGMIGLVFWDWLPMEISHKHYCSNAAGYTQYKTLKDWREENPGAWEAVIPAGQILSPSFGVRGNYTSVLNDRFSQRMTWRNMGFHIVEKRQILVDTESGDVLAQFVDYGTDIPALGLGGNELAHLKFWMHKDSCEEHLRENIRSDKSKFISYSYYLTYKRNLEHKTQ